VTGRGGSGPRVVSETIRNPCNGTIGGETSGVRREKRDGDGGEHGCKTLYEHMKMSNETP
jgi:hypothetical protein